MARVIGLRRPAARSGGDNFIVVRRIASVVQPVGACRV
jgi:hypothetical protein